MHSYPITQFAAEIRRPNAAQAVVAICRRLSLDEAQSDWFEAISERVASGTVYWDLACSLRQIAVGLQPSTYLEIGVRLGTSMAMVASTCPEAALLGFDLWITPYAGVHNPGPDHVRREMHKLGHRGSLNFISGDSQQTVPRYVLDHPSARFDVVTVDGDHSDYGAWVDLRSVADLVARGGYLLFDDLIHPAHTLLPIWRRFQAEYGDRFEFAENLEDHYGIGVARRRE